jgi:hypothetical protein
MANCWQAANGRDAGGSSQRFRSVKGVLRNFFMRHFHASKVYDDGLDLAG